MSKVELSEELKTKLDELQPAFKELFLEKPFKLAELGNFFDKFGEVVKEFHKDATTDECEEVLQEAFIYFDERNHLIDLLNSKVNIPLIPEWGEDKVYRYGVTKMFIPFLAAQISKVA